MEEKLFNGKLWPSECEDENVVVWKFSSWVSISADTVNAAKVQLESKSMIRKRR